ncbi:MAG: DUF2339 domain-containing protein [Candidatus Electrothrix sp. YB6]
MDVIIVLILVGIIAGSLLFLCIVVQQCKRLRQVEKRLTDNENLLKSLQKEEAPAEKPVIFQPEKEEQHEPEPSSPVENKTVETGPDQDGLESVRPAPSSPSSPSSKTESTGTKPAPPSPPKNTSDPVERVLSAVWKFFTQGNVVLRVGLLVLFFGVSFLLKYAVDRKLLTLSIELRLLGVALAGIGMLIFGWKVRLKRPGFALLMQGGAIGLLFLDVFAAFKLYDLLPMPLAFAVMIGLVCTSAALALLQDAKSLALFGTTGGFLAPVLLSTGSGSHVALFSYYALLNSGILLIAWFKAWRELNLLGFVFTLGIGSAWGVSSYEPRYFASTEPFLLLFFLMFTAIGVLFAFRQPPKLRGYVDGTLVFGTPIICFSLQAALVKDMPYGLALSALAVSLFYVGLASFLWNRGNERLRQGIRTLTEAFLALSVAFVTLAIPLALSGRWTAVTWAMEGAALIWVGVRQNRLLPRNVGVLLQFAAGFFFLASSQPVADRMILFNGICLGSLIISLSALFSSWYLYQAGQAGSLRRFEQYHHLPLFLWGIGWWFGGGINELSYQLVSYYNYHDYAVLLFIGLSCAALLMTAKKISWPIAAWPSLGLLPVIALVGADKIGWHGFFGSQHVSTDLGWLIWPVLFALLHFCLAQARARLPERPLCFTHIGGYLLLVLILTSEAAWQVHNLTGGTGAWNLIVWGLVPLLMLQLVQRERLTRFWPLSEYAAQYQEQAGGIIAFLLWVWLLAGALLSPGNAEPLPFLPLLNPLELSQLIVLLLLFRWLLLRREYVTAYIPLQTFAAAGGVTCFLWLNAVLARSVHHFGAVPFNVDAMFASRLYQAALSIFWGMLSLILMVTAHRLKHRTIWFVGIGLIGVTVSKLFLVDLANSGTVERIVSFLAVGILLIIIAYFAPLPPASAEENENNEEES